MYNCVAGEVTPKKHRDIPNGCQSLEKGGLRKRGVWSPVLH